MLLSQQVLYLLLIWFFGWGIYFYAGKERSRLATDADLSTAYFFFLAALSFYLSQGNLPAHIEDNIFYYFGAIILVFITVNHAYFLIRRKFKEPLTLIEEHPTDEWLTANRRSIFVTLSHILFQQIVITSLILSLWHKYGDIYLTAEYFAAAFAMMHILLFIFKGIRFTVLYTLPAVIAGLIFPIILIRFGFAGFVINYLVHSSFYVLITYLFWRGQGEIKS